MNKVYQCILTFVIAFAVVNPLYAQESSGSMGLKERKLREVIENENIPFHVRTFNDYCGGELDIEINWEQWNNDYDGLLNLNGYQLQQFTDALNLVGHDAVTKEAVAQRVQKLRIERVEKPDAISMDLKDGTLAIATAPAAGWEGVFNGREIADYLLEHL